MTHRSVLWLQANFRSKSHFYTAWLCVTQRCNWLMVLTRSSTQMGLSRWCVGNSPCPSEVLECIGWNKLPQRGKGGATIPRVLLKSLEHVLKYFLVALKDLKDKGMFKSENSGKWAVTALGRRNLIITTSPRWNACSPQQVWKNKLRKEKSGRGQGLVAQDNRWREECRVRERKGRVVWEF